MGYLCQKAVNAPIQLQVASNRRHGHDHSPPRMPPRSVILAARHEHLQAVLWADGNEVLVALAGAAGGRVEGDDAEQAAQHHFGFDQGEKLPQARPWPGDEAQKGILVVRLQHPRRIPTLRRMGRELAHMEKEGLMVNDGKCNNGAGM